MSPADAPHFTVQVSHPQYKTDQQLADWVKRLGIKTDPEHVVIYWTTPGSKQLGLAPELLIRFTADNQVEICVQDRLIKDPFTRTVRFLNACNDDECMQQLLDVFISGWAVLGMISMDVADVYSVLQASEQGVIAAVHDVKCFPDYCAHWQNNIAPMLGRGKLTSLLSVYRDYLPRLEDFGRYGDALSLIVDDDCIVAIGDVGVESPSERRNAVLYYGISGPE